MREGKLLELFFSHLVVGADLLRSSELGRRGGRKVKFSLSSGVERSKFEYVEFTALANAGGRVRGELLFFQ